MGKFKVFVPIVVSLVIAFSGSLFLYKWAENRRAPTEVIKIESAAIPVAVVKIDLPWGTKITPEMIETVPFLKESLPSGFFSNATDLNGRVSIAPLKKGDPVVEHRLAPTSVTTGGVSAILSPGKRAISVKGDKVIGISGFINPGNRVDVLVTLKNPDNKMEKTKTVLENILVLATGTQIIDNGKGEPAPVDVYTLEVTPEEGEKLSLSATRGRLQFALRNLTDTQKVLTSGATISQTLSSLSLPEPKKKVKLKKQWIPARSVTVEVIKGSELTKIKI